MRRHSLLYFSNSSISFWVRPPIKSRKLTQNGPFHSNDWLFIGGFISTFLVSTPTHPCLSMFYYVFKIIFHISSILSMRLFDSYDSHISGRIKMFLVMWELYMYGDGSCLEDHPTNRKWLPWLVSPHAVDFPFFPIYKWVIYVLYILLSYPILPYPILSYPIYLSLSLYLDIFKY